MGMIHVLPPSRIVGQEDIGQVGISASDLSANSVIRLRDASPLGVTAPHAELAR